MSIDKITARILKEAKDEAASQVAAAEKEASAKMAEANAKAMEIAAEMNARARDDAATLKERKKSVAELEGRKLVLGAKQEMIEKAFAQAVEELANMPEKEYIAFLREQLSGFKKGEVVLSARDLERIGKKLAPILEKAGLTLSKETADIAGGFILNEGSTSVNGSLESLLEAGKKQITSKLAEILFA